MNKRKLLEKLERNQKNVRFQDFVALVEAFGFREVRIKGSHHIYERSDIFDMVNIKNNKGQAKPYQIKQFLGLVETCNLELKDER